MSAPDAAPRTLRFATLNLWGENGPHERRLDLVAAACARLQPDVLALQEVREVPGRVPNQADTLARRLGWHHAFAPATPWGGGVEGLAILSRFPVLESAHRRLPHATETEGRIVMSARLAGPRGELWAHTTHLSYRQNEGHLREDQVVAVDGEVRARAKPDDQPQVVLGDFNTVPDADEMRWLRGLTTIGGRRVFYQDAWETARPAEPGITWAAENTFRARMGWLRADRRIDYILVTAARRDGRGTVRGAHVIFDRPDDDGVYPSDHFGVMTDVQIAPDEAPAPGANQPKDEAARRAPGDAGTDAREKAKG